MISIQIFSLIMLIIKSQSQLVLPQMKSDRQIPITINFNRLETFSNDLVGLLPYSTTGLSNWNARNYTLINDISQSIYTKMSRPSNFTDFGFDQIDSIIISSIDNFQVFNLTNRNIYFGKNDSTYSKTRMGNYSIYLIVIGQPASIRRYNRLNYNQSPVDYPLDASFFTISSSSYIYQKMSICQISSAQQFIVTWSATQAIELILFRNNTYQSYKKWGQIITTSGNQYITQIKFNLNCSIMTIQRNSLTDIQIYSTNLNLSILSIANSLQGVTRVQFYCLKLSNVLTVYYQNNSINFYRLTSNSVNFIMEYKSTLPLLGTSFIDFQSAKLYILQFPKIFVSLITCPNNTFQANQDKLCYTCPCNQNQRDCTNVPTECIYHQNSFNNSSNSSTDNNTNPQQDKLSDQFQPIISFNSYVLIIVSSISMISQIAPVALFFVSFINYWSLCSFYLLIQNVSKPQILADLLVQIFQSINFSIFQTLNMNFNIDTGLNNMLNDYFSSYNITSDFLLMHYQDAITLTFTCLIVAILVLIKLNVDSKSFLYKRLNLNFKMILLAQFTGVISNFIFPFDLIQTKMNYAQISNKINVVSHIVCIGLLMPIPFLVFIQVNTTKAYHKRQNKNTTSGIMCQLTFKKIKKQKRSQQFEYGLTYNGLCSLFLPLSIVIDIKPIIFIVGVITFTYGINQARKQKTFRINKIVLETYILAFHIAFFLMILFQNNQYIMHIFGIICSATLLIGAIHQTLNMIIQLLYGIYQIIRKYFCNNKVQNKNCLQKQKQRQIKDIKQLKFPTQSRFGRKIFNNDNKIFQLKKLDSSNILHQQFIQEKLKIKLQNKIKQNVQDKNLKIKRKIVLSFKNCKNKINERNIFAGSNNQSIQINKHNEQYKQKTKVEQKKIKIVKTLSKTKMIHFKQIIKN